MSHIGGILDLCGDFNPTFALGLALGSSCFILLLIQNFNDKTFLEISLFVIFLLVESFPLLIRGGQCVPYPIVVSYVKMTCMPSMLPLAAAREVFACDSNGMALVQSLFISLILASTLCIWSWFLCRWLAILDLNLGLGEPWAPLSWSEQHVNERSRVLICFGMNEVSTCGQGNSVTWCGVFY